MEQESKNCKNCGKKFYKNNLNGSSWKQKKFCSNKCKSGYNNYIKRKNNPEKEKKRNLDYYYQNREKVLSKQIKRLERLKKEDDEIRKLYNFRKIAQKEVSLKNKKCSFCGSKKDLQRHHENYNNPLDVLVLCRKCHNKIHNYKKSK